MKLRKIGKYYYACFTGPNGKPKAVSTRCAALEEARKVAKDSNIADLISASKATRLTHAVIGQVTTGRKVSMDKALAEFEQAMRTKGQSDKTINNYLTVLRCWLREQGIENIPPSAITEKHVDKWINKSGDATLGTLKVNLSTIRTFCNFLCDKGWAAGNPARLVAINRRNLTHEQLEPEERKPFTKAQLKRLLDWVKSDWEAAMSAYNRVKPEHRENHQALKLGDRIQALQFWDFAIRLSHETGLRLGSIAQLEWDSFAKAGVIIVHTKKTGARVEVPVSESILDLVSAIPVVHDTYLFPEEQRLSVDVKKRSLLSVRFSRLCAQAGVESISFHSLRHTRATENYKAADKEELAKRLAETLTVAEIATLLGHANAGVTKGYIHKG
jgi:integrase